MTNPTKEKKQDIGALWKKQGPKAEYMSGKITIGGATVSIVVFQNGYKKEATHPDFRIFVSTPKAEIKKVDESDGGPY